MGKYVIGIIVVVILALGGGFYLSLPQGEESAGGEAGGSMAVATSTYATSTFSIVYPSDYAVDDSYAYDQFGEKKLIHGVKFAIPGAMATGTNLSADSFVSVENLPRAKNCTGDIYILDNVKAQKVLDGGVEYSVATTSGAAAGNFYEEQVYALVGSSPCTAVRYFLHSTNIANYPEGSVREFDRAALIEALDTIRRSLVLNPQTP